MYQESPLTRNRSTTIKISIGAGTVETLGYLGGKLLEAWNELTRELKMMELCRKKALHTVEF